jgi:aspartate-semialdehyde dehydrogenase
MHPNVPLIVPPVNPDHLEMVKSQRAYSDTGAFIVTNANCSTTGMVIALEPIQQAFGIEAVMATTMQAISGAGYPGLSSLDMLDNVLPRIGGEEPKLEAEYRKIMGAFVSDGAARGTISPASFALSASSNRVHVRDGHMICLAIKLKTPATPAEVEKALAEFTPRDPLLLRMPSAPDAFVHVAPGGADSDRPQPRLDRDAGGGYTTVVGRVRECPVMDVKLTVCSHNTVMGAAGSSILNAELAAARRVLKPRMGVSSSAEALARS